MKLNSLFLAASLLTAAAVANAHHSFQATFKSDEEISVQGVVTEYRFKNPHVLVYLDVTDEQGNVINWMSEGSSATSLRRQGWGRETLVEGQYIRITGNPTHDGSPMVSIETVDILDKDSNEVVGTLGEQAAPAGRRPGGMGAANAAPVSIALRLADGRPNFSGAWTRNRTGPRGGSPEGLDGVPPFNLAGEAAQAAYNRADDPQIFCEPPGVVRQAGFTPHVVRITQNDDHLILEYEEYGGRRVVPLGDETPPPGTKSHLGDSVARYDGDRLIIETVNLLGNPTHPWGFQLSDQATTVEVYERTDSEQLGSVTTATMTVTDPGYLTEPWVLVRERLYAEGYEFIENDCRPPLRKRNVSDD